MAVRTITTRLALDGEAEYKRQIQNINAEYRVFSSELQKLEAQFKGQMNSLDALSQKEAALAGQQSLLQQRYQRQTEMLKQAQDAYNAQGRAVADLEKRYAALDTSTKNGADKQKKLGEELEKAKDKLQQAANSVTYYKTQINNTARDQINLDNRLKETRKYLDEAANSADHTAISIDSFGKQVEESTQELEQGAAATKATGDAVSQLAGVLQAAGVAATLKEITDAITACVDASKDFESAVASFNKVAKLNDEELAVFREEIQQLSTRLPATAVEITQVAEAGRRLGVEQDSLLSFTQTMIDLGNVSDLSADQAATALARFANIAGTSESDYERLGSTIVALGNNFATSESEIAAMASRLASAGTLAGLSESQIMGLAAAMSSVGIEAEAGGTAMTQTLTAMEKAVTSGGEDLEKFAEIAGMSSQAFSEAWSKDPITAIQAFIAGLGDLDEKGESATQVLDELGLSGIRQSNMLKSLALAAPELAAALDTANRAWEENTELAATAAEFYDTTEAKMQMAANAAQNLKIAVGDALTPALGDLASAGTVGFGWIAEVAEEHPEFVAAITAMVGVVGLFTGGVAAYTVAANLATAASGGLAAAMNMIPGVAAATAITGIVVAIRTFVSSAEEAKTANEALRESLESTKESLELSRAGAEETAQSLRGMADAIVQLADSAELTGVQYQALQDLIQQLNAAVPGLNLAYDEQTGKLNMTADAVRNLIDAESERLVNQEVARTYNDLLTQQMVIARQLTEAEVELEKARAANAAAAQNVIVNGERVLQLDKDLAAAQSEAAHTVGELKQQYDTLQEAINDLETKYGELPSSLDEAADAFEGTAQDAAQSMEDLQSSLKDLEKATQSLTEAQDTLTKALKEQTEEGSLSYETSRKLIDAGYAAALAIDEETGAVTLNKDRYVQLTAAKIDEQIAALESQRQAILSADALYQEAAAAQHAGSAYWQAAKDKIAYSHADDYAAIDTQIAALNRLRSTLGQTSAAATTASRRSSAASKQAKTQAEQDLAEYKRLKAELDHQKNMDLVDEEAYYRQLGEYRDQYLTDEANVSEYRKVTEQIFKFDQDLADKELKLWKEQSKELLSQLQERMDEITKAQDAMRDRMSGYGDLFTITTDKETKQKSMALNSLQEQINAINAYEKTLTDLRERGISKSLLDEILSMNVDEATKYGQRLLGRSEESWEEYNRLWEEKQRRAAEVAEKFFQEEKAALEGEYTSELGAALDTLVDAAYEGGSNTMREMVQGLKDHKGALFSEAWSIAAEMAGILNGAMSSVSAAMNPNNLRVPAAVTPQDLIQTGTAMVNGVQTAVASQPILVEVTSRMDVNGKKFFEEVLPDLRFVEKSNPEVRSDA